MTNDEEDAAEELAARMYAARSNGVEGIEMNETPSVTPYNAYTQSEPREIDKAIWYIHQWRRQLQSVACKDLRSRRYNVDTGMIKLLSHLVNELYHERHLAAFAELGTQESLTDPADILRFIDEIAQRDLDMREELRII